MKLAMLLASIIPLLFVATNVEAHSGHSPGNMPKPDGADDPDQLWGWGAVVGTWLGRGYDEYNHPKDKLKPASDLPDQLPGMGGHELKLKPKPAADAPMPPPSPPPPSPSAPMPPPSPPPPSPSAPMPPPSPPPPSPASAPMPPPAPPPPAPASTPSPPGPPSLLLCEDAGFCQHELQTVMDKITKCYTMQYITSCTLTCGYCPPLKLPYLF